MHFSPPKLRHFKSKSSVRSDTDKTPHPKKEEGEKGEGEEEVSEWIEGRDVVIERKPCVPGEDVQVEVLHGAAAAADGHHHNGEHEIKKAKEGLKRRGRKEERDVEAEAGKLMGKCKEAGQVIGIGKGKEKEKGREGHEASGSGC